MEISYVNQKGFTFSDPCPSCPSSFHPQDRSLLHVVIAALCLPPYNFKYKYEKGEKKEEEKRSNLLLKKCKFYEVKK